MPRRFLRILALVVLAALGSAPVAAEAVDDAIRRRVEKLQSGDEVRIGAARLTSVALIPRLYERRGFTPAWSERGAGAQLVALIRSAETHGLVANDYHLGELERLGARAAAGDPDPEHLADRDLLLTDALLRVTYHALFGKVDPESLDPHWNLERDPDPDDAVDPAATLQRIIDSGSIASALEELAPEEPLYRSLREALARYLAIQDAGGWEPVPAGPKLERGVEDPRVVALRYRLAITGDLPADAIASPVFDDALEESVKRFQRRQRLDADGVVGAGTLEALNVPVEARIDQIRVNLERARWVLRGLRGRFVLVDIAGFEARYIVDDVPVWQSRVQVGRPYRKTPVFRDDIRYLEINPTWTVPPGILARDVLPRIQKDVGYLARSEMRVADLDGRRVDPESIDWSQVTARGFPYRIVQAPGPRNALGRIKFMFPNKHLVFLHDTPSRSLFERTDRAFSSGCIRVQDPFELAELLLADPEKWNLEKLRAAVDAKQTLRVNLPEPVPVVLLYWTIQVAPDGSVHFKKDVYQRDAAILVALDEDFAIRARHRGVLGEP